MSGWTWPGAWNSARPTHGTCDDCGVPGCLRIRLERTDGAVRFVCSPCFQAQGLTQPPPSSPRYWTPPPTYTLEDRQEYGRYMADRLSAAATITPAEETADA